MALELTFSCDSDKTDDGPTLIHSTGVEHYKISPEVIQLLQHALSNEFLSDHDDGVLCQASPQRVLDILVQNGFTLQSENNDDQKASWTVAQVGQNQDSSEQPQAGDEKEADGDASGPQEDGGDEQVPGEDAPNQEDEEQEKED